MLFLQKLIKYINGSFKVEKITKIRPGMAEIQAKTCGHRVDRVLSFHLQSSELGLPHPLARRRVCPPWFRGEGTLACGRGEGAGGFQFQRGDRHSGTLGIYVYFKLFITKQVPYHY
jgi:hypothetical protein